MRFYRYAITAAVLAGSSLSGQAQTKKRAVAPPPAPYKAVDARMQHIPDSSTHSVDALARYINASFSTEADKARAAFGWVARNIRYDQANMYVIEFERESAKVVQETLDKRRGVCRHYAELYSALANRLGLRTYVVPGYISLREPTTHAWCATRIDGQWYLMDPTWALETRTVNGKPLVIMRDDYFRMKPAAAIESHMPFDPLWQLLKNPRTPEQFQYGKTPPPPARPFAYLDSLAVYEQQSPLERIRASNRRVEQNGVKSGVIFHYLAVGRQREEFYRVERYNEQVARQHEQSTRYNQAVAHLNVGIERLNAFIDFYNRQFLPKKTDAELQQLLPPVAAELAEARQLLTSGPYEDPSIQTLAQQLQQQLAASETKLQNCQAFMDRYLRTGKLLRPVMFTNLDAPRNEILR